MEACGENTLWGHWEFQLQSKIEALLYSSATQGNYAIPKAATGKNGKQGWALSSYSVLMIHSWEYLTIGSRVAQFYCGPGKEMGWG